MHVNIGIRSPGAFVLFADCIAVKGARRSVICDLQRRRLRFIPGTLYDILTVHARASLQEIQNAYPAAHHATIAEYFHALSEEAYGFWTDEPDHFEAPDMNWQRAALCTNSIVDVSSESAHDFASIFGQLDALGCESVQVRIHDEIPAERILDIVQCAERWRFRHLEILAKESDAVNWAFVRKLCDEHAVVSAAILHSAREERHEFFGTLGEEIRTTRSALDIRRCGYVAPESFTINTPHFTEARCANSCLNGKLSVAANGDIMACPSMAHSYGNVREHALSAVLERADLQRLWGITKDQVQVCKDCEFRYICTDCRAHTKDGGLFSKPSSCTYDPYIARWE